MPEEGKNPNAIMYAVVNMVAKNLTDDELNTLYLATRLGSDPRNAMGYPKAFSLFTEENGTKMHEATREMFEVIWKQRIGSKIDKG